MPMTGKDGSWVLTSAVIIFTMQTGGWLAGYICTYYKDL
jgi:hypothetical protein